MYFAWLGHYTTALSIPASVGFLFWVSVIVIFNFIIMEVIWHFINKNKKNKIKIKFYKKITIIIQLSYYV